MGVREHPFSSYAKRGSWIFSGLIFGKEEGVKNCFFESLICKPAFVRYIYNDGETNKKTFVYTASTTTEKTLNLPVELRREEAGLLTTINKTLLLK